MYKKIYIFVILGSLLFHFANACTVWGAFMPNELLIAKNRDFYPGNQKFMTINNKGKYSFFGLYGDNQYDNNYTIKMGVNETGLVVFMTFASTIPIAKRTGQIPYFKVMENILENYNDVNNIYKDSKTLFRDSTPINYIFADKTKALICEIGLQNDYKCIPYLRIDKPKINSSGITTFAQTNHYIIPELEKYNLTPIGDQQTSYYRLNKIDDLMKNNLKALNFKQFVSFSFNTQGVNDYPLAKFDSGYDNTYQDNSIFRTFNSHPDRKNKNHPNSDQGVSTMVIKLPVDKDEPIELYLRIINSIVDSKDKKYTQNIKYSEATTTLDNAINNPGSIRYQDKVCIRDIQSKSCL